ncbi:ferredoxin-type protein NapF [Tropicimonas sediminicola]|uniref:Ferredoxin-type protein NapF n=1 Tax=Tropicimonas sediminicola TaxID=1031541 RepID=A0A239F458_9RHOB|nr:ferredoxin-type protein NapF [Tropicimonas sediminicola]SNS51627.1 ferredoxin-type protein NapF [Tropicimonas sediminicola]
MPIPTSRRDFLRGSLRGGEFLRPPGARPAGFERACTGCGDCAAACPEAIIQTDNRGAVRLDLALGACTFCGDCARACPTDALSADRLGDWPWVATISAECLSLNAVSCRACEDACEPRAIRFRPALGGRAQPIVDDEGCTGCGGCISICPVGAVSLSHRAPAECEVTQ